MIRRAETEDLPAIAELARFTWRTSFPGIITSEQIEYMLAQRYAPEAMQEAVESGRLVFEVLCVDGIPRAFAAHGPADGTGETKLQQLYVHPEWQGRGLGGRLLGHVESLASARGDIRVSLTVNRRNARALQTYERHGYRIRCEAVINIGNGFVMDDYVMEKRLDSEPGHQERRVSRG